MPTTDIAEKEKWVDEIPPPAKGGGGRRGSKYDPLLDKVKARAEKRDDGRAVKELKMASNKKAWAYAQTIRRAAEKRDDSDHFEIASRGDSIHVSYTT